jgi:hypothetical protein
MTELAGAEARRGVGEHGEADDIQAIAVAQSSLVDEHALAKVAFGIALNLDMDQDRDGLSIECLHAHQFVGVAPTARAGGADLLQFLVEKLRRYAPVDPGVDGWEQQRQELGEEAFQRFFPGAVVVAFGASAGVGVSAVMGRV